MKNMIVVALLALVVSGCASMRHHTLYEGDPAQMSHIISFDTVLIKYVDDEDMGVSFIGQKQTYDLKAGKHVLLVEYSDLFDVGSDEHEKVVSRPAKVTFVAEAGKQYQIQHPKQQRLDNAKAFAQKPEFYVVEVGSGNRVAAEVELSRPRSFLAGLKLENTPEYEFASDSVATANNAAGAAPITVSASGSGLSNNNAATDGGEISNLKMLQYSWKNASAQERATFLEWVKQQ